MHTPSTPLKAINLSQSPQRRSVNISQELTKAQQRTLEYSKALSSRLQEFQSKSFNGPPTEEDPWQFHKELVTLSENYCSYLQSQPTKTAQKQKDIESVNSNLQKGLSELEETQEHEKLRLSKKVSQLNSDFTKKYEKVQREALKQLEQLKNNLVNQIREEQKTSQTRVQEKVAQIKKSIAPETSKFAIRSSSVRAKSPSKNNKLSTPSKALKTKQVYEKLEQSRQKLRNLYSNSTTPIKSLADSTELFSADTPPSPHSPLIKLHPIIH